MSAQGRWSDLGPRIGSAVVLVAVSLAAVWIGGAVFQGFIALACSAMVWELTRMLDPAMRNRAVPLGLLGGAAIFAAVYLPAIAGIALLLAVALIGGAVLSRHRVILVLYGALILLAGYEMIALRAVSVVWLLWLISVVIASDVAGYFAGKVIGGAKFWPRISPNKTWSGTGAGWLGAALVGLGFAVTQNVTLALVPMSVLVAFAAQMGDIAESAIKRRVGVKDSSGLIPGHGGFLDRFDGMLGAALLVLLIGAWIGLPQGTF
ncbi:phosphatidate cytidylyltransferase [Pontibaca salina]|uniref:Phosphatidate cytidylyltransferase n=1 Tax=Pontibaca salina TaxID=2795731 RepID=A0A934HVQ5_9RHOB|nr:phosphatidate cytidylyltransferase [Pontibaca salina]MBI6630399.1 phosphatidate cytidylyltransferase [Pontibaca salina]